VVEIFNYKETFIMHSWLWRNNIWHGGLSSSDSGQVQR